MHRLLLALAVLLPLAACDSSGDDFFDDPYLSVYDLTATDEDGDTVVSGTIGLTLLPSDVSSIPDGYTGRWEVETRGTWPGTLPPDGRGDLRGEGQGNMAEVLFYDDIPNAPTDFYLLFDPGAVSSGGTLSGTWEIRGGFTGGAIASGPFTARLTREATEFYTAG